MPCSILKLTCNTQLKTLQHNELPPIHPYSPFEVIQLSRNRVNVTPMGHASVQLPQDASRSEVFFPPIQERPISQFEKERFDSIHAKMDSIKALNDSLSAEKETPQTPPALIPKSPPQEAKKKNKYSRHIFDPEVFQAQLMKPLKALQKVTFDRRESQASEKERVDKSSLKARDQSSVIYAWDQWNQTQSMQKRLASRFESKTKDTVKESVPIQPVSLLRGESEVGFVCNS
jgi:hypothetical protein